MQNKRLIRRSSYFNDFFVYDTETDVFGFANALPINNASPDQVRLPDGRLLVPTPQYKQSHVTCLGDPDSC